MSFRDGVTEKVNSTRPLCFVPAIQGLERFFLGRMKNHFGRAFMANWVKHSLVINRLLDHFARENVAVVCLYRDFQDQDKQTAANMIDAFTKQLANALKMVPTEIEEAFERAEREVGGRGLQVSETVKLCSLPLLP